MSEIIIDKSQENKLKQQLQQRGGADAARILRLLNMPDLSRTVGSPLKEIVDRASKVKSLVGFDVIEIPEIIPIDIFFDLFNMPPGHPARSRSDTYYVDDGHILRSHDTVFWYYYLNDPEIKKRIVNKETLGAICYGKVYRKDEIDRTHMNVFHQFGAWYIGPDEGKNIIPDDLKRTLSEVAESLGINHRFYDHNFPYTDPSFEMEMEMNGKWVELVGSGMVRKSVLQNFGLTGYHGWAFGFGLERLAIGNMRLPDIRLLWSTDPRVTKQLKLGQKFVEVSKFPPITRDISFIVKKNTNFVPNNYFDLIRDIGGDLVEEVALLDKYENPDRIGADNVSYTYRVVYRSNDRTLTDNEIQPLQNRLIDETEHQFQAEIR
ncbi:MAG: hypothetical protein A3J07_02805 [Candidatus Doudnabacteria bacterium RIFCSPLOWO2_02_FULL_49_13]|uniref:phenylalanine--tRNA ligase n=1 Tax=Candidatus Doudnabacteria bacterium RIFCSPHIGHO2_12_FULL_48_16 TaxID=1817838 RepID=A0A1F5PL72_9BACT|nr:MAG: hypothetical protein A3B77_01445 [Candidatus Doudnabacteria bacterium RIFCSPHIGHO2_02_FULL_49_24]OGE88110.1 MAG: hypothetical protein A2760_00880 [Candidatus Doudnabacteria bacterium RIFCSPHIGHO2_01_FULL_50_67]OGE90607.1 MAG: hypothetical protein A3E29_02315 [Candidatus Doudnabacteria bacterium RIFCSPHIGHO2_12_FULL_48_16]OGE96469.1 MAG: hypothetical protein A2990_04280 [Candidatus Doudnabacteria bacterium RIFCSPLOWO2_01_FULL_49_40]OGF03000.1 MAG: hypothetical protein A3J07_02805 [Candid